MKLIETAYELNADNENFEKGYRVEISKVELSIIQIALNAFDNNENFKTQTDSVHEKFERMKMYASKGFKNIEI